ncbi:GLABROUS1 enhancer-binding protein family [Dillenia turbinata]|uniref:GLABROUS1 enhancer-binding protein family n=1 Tax=Dillenia turbinata TaxID=194707 RepID=A0AAN8YX16_9MAGN
MASREHQNAFNEESLDDDDSEEDHHQNEVVVDDDDLEEEDEIDIDDDDDIEEEDVVTFTSPPNTVTVTLPAIPNGVASISSDVVSDPPPPQQPQPMLVVAGSSSAPDLSGQKTEERKPLPLADESRRLFQRLWTDEDEIELLQGFLNYTTQRGTQNSSHHLDTSLFYDRIRGKLQLDFNKNQLVEKLRRLKKKYRNVLNRISSGKEFAFKTPHDQTTFEISRKIWSGLGSKIEENALEDDDPNPNPSPNTTPNIADHNNNGVSSVDLSEKKVSRKRSRQKLAEKMPAAPVNSTTPISASIPSMIEDTVRSCLSPLFKELINNAVSGPCGSRGFGLGFGGGMTLNPMPLNFGPSINLSSNEAVDEKWRKQQILELEVYSKRLELVQDQIKNALEELSSVASAQIFFKSAVYIDRTIEMGAELERKFCGWGSFDPTQCTIHPLLQRNVTVQFSTLATNEPLHMGLWSILTGSLIIIPNKNHLLVDLSEESWEGSQSLRSLSPTSSLAGLDLIPYGLKKFRDDCWISALQSSNGEFKSIGGGCGIIRVPLSASAMKSSKPMAMAASALAPYTNLCFKEISSDQIRKKIFELGQYSSRPCCDSSQPLHHYEQQQHQRGLHHHIPHPYKLPQQLLLKICGLYPVPLFQKTAKKVP